MARLCGPAPTIRQTSAFSQGHDFVNYTCGPRGWVLPIFLSFSISSRKHASLFSPHMRFSWRFPPSHGYVAGSTPFCLSVPRPVQKFSPFPPTVSPVLFPGTSGLRVSPQNVFAPLRPTDSMRSRVFFLQRNDAFPVSFPPPPERFHSGFT